MISVAAVDSAALMICGEEVIRINPKLKVIKLTLNVWFLQLSMLTGNASIEIFD